MEKEELYSKIVEWLSNMGSVVNDEVPGFVREVADYGFYSNVISSISMFIVMSLFLCLSFITFQKAKTFVKKSMYDNCEKVWIMTVVFFLVSGLCFIIMTNCACNAIKSRVAPGLYVIERFIK
jgi:hypothetical protein